MRGKTAAQLMEILKARGLPVRGKKEELVAAPARSTGPRQAGCRSRLS